MQHRSHRRQDPRLRIVSEPPPIDIEYAEQECLTDLLSVAQRHLLVLTGTDSPWLPALQEVQRVCHAHLDQHPSSLAQSG